MKRSLSKVLATIAISVLVAGCGYSPENVKVADIYSGKKIQLLEKMSKDDRELLTKYMARKIMRVQKYQDNVLVYDSNTDLGTGDFITANAFENISGSGSVIINTEKVILDALKGESELSGVSLNDKNGSVSINGKEITAKNSFVQVNNKNLNLIVTEIDGQRIVVQSLYPGAEDLKKVLGKVSVSEAISEQKIYEEKAKEREAVREKNQAEYDKQQELGKKIRVSLIEKQLYGEDLSLMFAFVNRFDKEIVALRGIVEFYDEKNEKFYRALVSEYSGINAKSSVVFNGDFKLNKENAGEKKLLDIDEDVLKVKFVVTDVLFKDGEVFGEENFTSKAEVLLKQLETVYAKDRQEVFEKIINNK